MVKFKWEKDFKESEIGNVPRDWEFKTLGDILDIKHGFAFPSKSFRNEGEVPAIKIANINEDNFINLDRVNFINPSEIEKNLEKFYLKNGDILIALTGATAGKIGILRGRYEKYLLNQRVGKFEITDGKSSLMFVFYFLRSDIYRDVLLDLADGSAQGNMSPSFIRTHIKITCPQPKEQFHIASVLLWLDDLIENKKRQNDLLEKSAEAVFKGWFIDFEPFKKEKFENSELGKIPKGWEVRPIGQVATLDTGISYSSPEKFLEPVDDSYIFITLNNAIEGSGFKPEYAWIKSDRIKEKHFIRDSDLILPNTEQTKDERLLGSPGIAFLPSDYKKDKGIFSMDITKISVNDLKYKYFLYFFLKFTREESASFHSGTSILHFDVKNFRLNKLVLKPKDDILQKFDSLVNPLFQKIIRNQKEVMTLRKIKDTLLPLLVFGRLRVEEI